jgi:hypothetical protein
MENKELKIKPIANIKFYFVAFLFIIVIGYLIYDVANRIISERHWFGPFCFGFFGSILLLGITIRAWNFLFKLLGHEDPLEVFKEKPFWIDSIDQGVSGGLFSFLCFYLTLMSHVWLKIEIDDQRILIFSIVYLAIASFASWWNWLRDGNKRGAIFFTIGVFAGAFIAFFLFSASPEYG